MTLPPIANRDWRAHVQTMMLRVLAIVMLGATLAACATPPTPYQPRVDGYGYTEQQLDSRTWRVQFAGNSVTPRETVDNYLLYRAAEIMLFGGFDKFVVLEKDIERDTAYQGYGGVPRFGFGVFHGGGIGYGYSGDYGPDSYYPRVSYAGFATIRTFTGGRVTDGAVVYDARELVEQLGPTIKLPPKADG